MLVVRQFLKSPLSALRAGADVALGDANVIIGANAELSGASGTRQIVIGYNVTGQGNCCITMGDDSGKIYNAFRVNATWTQTSDERLKKNVAIDPLGLSFINRLQPVTYNWKASNELEVDNPYYREENDRDTETTMHGLIAQEVKQALDEEGISTFAGWSQGEDGIQGISREMFISPLINAVKELAEKNKELEARLAALEGA